MLFPFQAFQEFLWQAKIKEQLMRYAIVVEKAENNYSA
jgi:ribosomal protein S6